MFKPISSTAHFFRIHLRFVSINSGVDRHDAACARLSAAPICDYHASEMTHLFSKLFALIATSLGVMSVLALTVSMTRLYPSFSVDAEPTSSPSVALAIDLGLLALFGLQHSGMARSSFKQKLKHWLPMVPERSIYVFASGLMTFLILFTWQPIAGVIWSFSSGPANWLLWSGFGLGQLFLLAALLALDPFELLGLRQVGLLPAREDTFKLSWLHRRVRHPIYTGFILIFWMTPTMTAGHLLFSAGMTLYIRVGIYFEERDLLNRFPDEYKRYKSEVPMLLPRFTAKVSK